MRNARQPNIKTDTFSASAENGNKLKLEKDVQKTCDIVVTA